MYRAFREPTAFPLFKRTTARAVSTVGSILYGLTNEEAKIILTCGLSIHRMAGIFGRRRAASIRTLPSLTNFFGGCAWIKSQEIYTWSITTAATTTTCAQTFIWLVPSTGGKIFANGKKRTPPSFPTRKFFLATTPISPPIMDTSPPSGRAWMKEKQAFG